ncbi:hypothetical protein [Streptomyces sp. BK561]
MGEIVRYENVYRLCHVREPEGIVVKLAEHLTSGRRGAPCPWTAPRVA